MATNYFRGTFEDKNGQRVTKEFTSTSKSSTQIRTEAISKMKERGYKYVSGSLGTRA